MSDVTWDRKTGPVIYQTCKIISKALKDQNYVTAIKSTADFVEVVLSLEIPFHLCKEAFSIVVMPLVLQPYY